METHEWYKNFGIRYTQINGTTYVEDFGQVIKEFRALGSIEANKRAKAWIDDNLNLNLI